MKQRSNSHRLHGAHVPCSHSWQCSGLNGPQWFYKFEATISTGFSTWVVKMHSKAVSKPQCLFSRIKNGHVLFDYFWITSYVLNLEDSNFLESQSPYTPLLKNHTESSTSLNIQQTWAHSTYWVLINSWLYMVELQTDLPSMTTNLKQSLPRWNLFDFHHSPYHWHRISCLSTCHLSPVSLFCYNVSHMQTLWITHPQQPRKVLGKK